MTAKSFLTTVILTLLIAEFVRSSVPLEDFFTFGDATTDSQLPKADDESSPEISLSVPFPFFNHLHATAFVNINGGISFLQAIRTYTPSCTPMQQNLRMVMGFWADINLRGNDNGDGYYRQSIDSNLLKKAAEEIASALPDNRRLNLKWLFIATWHDVYYYGGNAASSEKKRNTFQVILTTDGVRSFALLYYNKITWTTGTSSGGNAQTGLGGSPARAGFDAGDGQRIVIIPGSCTNDIVNIATTSNYGQPGKWIFRIDSDIQSAGCTNSGTEIQKLQIAPVFVDVWGNVPIELLGPCFKETDSITCDFHDLKKGPIRAAGEIDNSTSDVRAFCNVPLISDIGRIQVQLRLNNEIGLRVFPGTLYIVNAEEGSGLHFTSVPSASLEGRSVTQISMNFTWNPQEFLPGTDKLVLTLHIYNELSDKWEKLDTLSPAVPNTGELLNFKVWSHVLDSQSVLNSVISFGLEPAVKPDPSKGTLSDMVGFRKIIMSKVYSGVEIMKAWSMETYTEMKDMYCNSWHERDKGPPTDLIPCPPALSQAQQDPRFEKDQACNQPPCRFHPGVDVCYRSVGISPSGSGQQCCYANGNIKIGPPGGGTVDRCHSKNGPLSICHFFMDVIPWFLCCSHEPSGQQCRKYYEKRPSDTGKNYVFPNPGRGTGDPHIATFDRLSYTFNGAGDFWMVKNTSTCPISIQARMEIYQTSPSQAEQASVFTAFALQDGLSPVLTIKHSAIRKLDVFVNEEPLDFSNSVLLEQRFPRMQLSMSADMSRITVDLSSGIIVVITWGSEALSVVFLGDDKMKGKTSGLLGNFDGNPDNDLTDPDGFLLPPDVPMRAIHFQFGVKWRVLERDCLFQYTPQRSYDYYNILNFEPRFLVVNTSNAPSAALAACGQVQECLYDFVTTGNANFASETKSTVQKFDELVNASKEAVIVCPALNKPANGYIIADNYLSGSTATFNCNPGFELSGNSALRCSSIGRWDGSEPDCNPNNGALVKHTTVVNLLVVVAVASCVSY